MFSKKIITFFIFCQSALFCADMTQIVHVYGKKLSSADVLYQVENQTGIVIDNRLRDNYGFRKNYDSHVSVSKILDSLEEYYLEFNKSKISISDRGHNKLVLEDSKRVVEEPSVSEEKIIPPMRKKSKETVVLKSTKIKGFVVNSSDEKIHAVSSYDDGLELGAMLVSSESKKIASLDVDIVEGKKSMKIANNKLDLGFDDIVFKENIPNLDMKMNFDGEDTSFLKRVSLFEKKSVFTGGILGLTGALSGFLATPHIPMTLATDSWNVAVETSIQVEKASALTGGVAETFDSEYISLNLEGRKKIHKNTELVLGLGIATHTGDFSLIGVSNSTLDQGFEDLKLGVNYFYDTGVLPLVFNSTLKIPLGSVAGLLSTGHADGSMNIGSFYSLGDVLVKGQIGYIFWGGSDVYHEGVDGGFDAMIEAHYSMMNEIDALVRLYYTESPFKNLNAADFYTDTSIKLQVGSRLNLLGQQIYILANVGLTDTASDSGLVLHWETFLN